LPLKCENLLLNGGETENVNADYVGSE